MDRSFQIDFEIVVAVGTAQNGDSLKTGTGYPFAQMPLTCATSAWCLRPRLAGMRRRPKMRSSVAAKSRESGDNNSLAKKKGPVEMPAGPHEGRRKSRTQGKLKRQTLAAPFASATAAAATRPRSSAAIARPRTAAVGRLWAASRTPRRAATARLAIVRLRITPARWGGLL